MKAHKAIPFNLLPVKEVIADSFHFWQNGVLFYHRNKQRECLGFIGTYVYCPLCAKLAPPIVLLWTKFLDTKKLMAEE